MIMHDNKIGDVEESHRKVLRRNCIIINTGLVTIKRSCSQKY